MYSRLNPARMDREDERRMLPCRYFLSGFCHKGNRCKFYHPNAHTRDPVIRTPDLPLDFHADRQYHQFSQSHGIPSLLDLPPRATTSTSRNRMFGPGHNSPSTRGGTSISPLPSPRSSNPGLKTFMSPQSQSYSEYLQQQRKNLEQEQEHEVEEETVVSSEESKSSQYTIFNHIDWSEFLAPGVCPPPPTKVPDQGTPASPDRVLDCDIGFSGLWRPSDYELAKVQKNVHVQKVNSEDIPPEGSQVNGSIMLSSLSHPGIPGKLSAKEELQLKVKQIAQELADEPVQHVRSLDSFFRNFKFNGFACPGSPTSVNQDNDVEESADGDKEDATEVEVEDEKEQPTESVEFDLVSSTMDAIHLETGTGDSSIEKSLSPVSCPRNI